MFVVHAALTHTACMWLWIAFAVLAWLTVSAAVALVLARFLFVAETEEELVEMQRAQRDCSSPPMTR